VWVEDESIAIGKIFLPKDLWDQMAQSPLIQMDVPKQVRIQRLVNEYGPANREEFLAIMGKIVKKLGGQNFKLASEKLQENDMFSVMEILLTYYDKAYLGSIEKRKNRIQLSLEWDGQNVEDYASRLRESLTVVR
jgi:tRNA 2-selenouridine synthase